jgi:heavy metal sensor kinase
VNLPIRVRLTLVFTVLMAMVLLAVGTLVGAGFRVQQDDAAANALRARAEAATDALEQGRRPFRYTAGEPDEAFGQVLTTGGSVLLASPAVRGESLISPNELAGLSSPTFFDRTVPTTEEPVTARLLVTPGPDDQVIVVGASLEDQIDAAEHLTLLSVVGGVIAVVLAGVVGWVVTGAALRPVEQMRREADAITESDWDRRLPVPPRDDELSRLASTLNAMLGRLQGAMRREQRFVADASHELRTPLTNLRAEIDLALRHPGDANALREALESSGEETDRLVRLTRDLLLLAQSNEGSSAVVREPVDLGRLAEQAATGFRARADERQVTVRVDAPAGLLVQVDPDRIRQAIENLIDNALSHAPPGTSVDVRVEASADAVRLTVDDQGPGFDDEFLPRVFEPFSRADEGRTRGAGGTGLGLAIVEAIVHDHDGTAQACQRPGGGGRVVVELPR